MSSTSTCLGVLLTATHKRVSQLLTPDPVLQTTLKETAYKLATLLISFSKFYSFEFLFNQAENKLSESLSRLTAFRLQELFQGFIKSKNEQYDNIEREAGKVTVLVVDRSYDPATPLLHDFFYQPIVYDLLDVKNDIYE